MTSFNNYRRFAGLMGDVELLFKMAESTDEVKGQFLFCPVCRLNHDQGRKHIYTRKHKTSLGKILLKFGKKVGSLQRLQRKDFCIHNSEEKQQQTTFLRYNETYLRRQIKISCLSWSLYISSFFHLKQ